MKIERVAKKDAQNVIVYLDNDSKLFLSYEILLKHGLRKDKEISESHFSFLAEENQKYFIKQRALNYLSRRLHSKNELRQKLLQKKYSIELISLILNELEANGLIDDSKFAVQFSEEKIRTKLWGIRKLSAELQKKGIAREIIDTISQSFFPEEENEENAFKAGEKKLKSLSKRNLEFQKVKEKLFAFLLSKGYDYSTTRRVSEKLLNREAVGEE